jgi:hypothetical protein
VKRLLLLLLLEIVRIVAPQFAWHVLDSFSWTMAFWFVPKNTS